MYTLIFALYLNNSHFLSEDNKKYLYFILGGRNTSFLPHSTANQSIISAWLNNDPTKDRIEITNLSSNSTLSINSLDVLGSFLVYGTDTESIYVKKDLFV